jgi:NAD-dependent deacetylase
VARHLRTLAEAADLCATRTRITVLTGAGISTASGIPDYRGPDGVWTKNPKAERVSTLDWYVNDPEVRAIAWQTELHSPAREARPNAAHLAITDLQRAGRLRACVTSNIDGLHTDAGTTDVIEVHGSSRRWRCEDCPATGAMPEMLDRVLAGDRDPRCPTCGGITRATTILFGEFLDPEVIDAASRAAASCDLFIAVGTSLTVHPAAGLLPLAIRSGAPAIIVNAQETPYDDQATAVIREPIATALPHLLTAAS